MVNPDSMKKTVLITGAGKGLGRAILECFVTAGWRVIASDYNPDLLHDLDGRDGIITMTLDVTSDDSVKEAARVTRQVTGEIDLVVNNAGIDKYFPLSDAPVEFIKSIFEVNFFGVIRVNVAFLPLLKKPGGRIIMIGSESLNLTMPFLSYPLTKRAVESYARGLRQELYFAGIDVTVVRPGAIRTDIISNLAHISNPLENSLLAGVFENFKRSVLSEVPNSVEAAEVAAVVYKAATVPHPKAVYKINNSIRLRIAALVPFSIIEKTVRRMLK
jgi:NAD(P)-dependent dehydrogenase (short-subunit alcohol dehydrogenase family)